MNFAKIWNELKFEFFLVRRLHASGRRLWSLPAVMSVSGMAMGVACLIVAMAVISGFESTLRDSVIDVFGHVLVARRGERSANISESLAKIKAVAPEIVASVPFLQFEGVLAAQQKISGVLVQGLDPQELKNVLNLESRMVAGKFSFDQFAPEATAMVGKGIYRKFGLHLGDVIQVVLPTPSKDSTTDFQPHVLKFKVGGVLDLGKNDYDERYILTDLASAQKLSGFDRLFSGFRLKLANADQARAVSARISAELGATFWTMDWADVNKNLFDAVVYERVAIFFVLLVMVIAASFNISSHLFVSVLVRFQDISILRAMGFSQPHVMRLFAIHGLIFGVLGLGFGVLLGFLLCSLFVLAQKYWIVLPADIYKLDHVGIEIRPVDLLLIVIATLLICLVSTLAPARRGARLETVEGLRYE